MARREQLRVLPRMPVIPPPMSAAFPAAFTKSGAIPGGGGPAYDAAAPLTEGRSMEASRSESGAAAGSWFRKPRQQGSPARPRVKLPVPSELKRDA